MDQDIATLRAAVGQDGIIQISNAIHRLGGGEEGKARVFDVLRSGWAVIMRPVGKGPSEAIRVLAP